jgi:hypothetical protein
MRSSEISADLTRSNSLDELADRIHAEHEASVAALRRGVEHAVAAGHLLLEAKAQLKHGEWLPWLREHCRVPVRTCQLYMDVAKHVADGKSASLAYLPSELTVPDPDSEAFALGLLEGPSSPECKWLWDGPLRAWDFADRAEWLFR